MTAVSNTYHFHICHVTENASMESCASSGGWLEQQQLQLLCGVVTEFD
jgi:hypothetical protein